MPTGLERATKGGGVPHRGLAVGLGWRLRLER